ncbi:PREDICTED: nascent polypeptide-associated complex subunit alpha, muscle-specific form-like [Gekko japonicus]|uniref:Nascent polypeptide-associated complex subunit alpha, muscle-specific form-like n=1 Tax=Gekko japonicus TaxID=146911 RepID=A0ABM1JJC1_GEKJA|nr:PREDICTED: nascent polypeptide-associated complex subunit alpha, muscle-specific form-like [Gekko japonicus]
MTDYLVTVLQMPMYPNWAPENPCSPKRHEADRQERHESRQRSASPSPKRSRRSSSGHARHWTRSRSRSSGRHRASRPRSRSPSRHSASPCPKHSRCSGSGYARHRTRSRSRSSERHRTSRPRSRSPRHPPSPRHHSRSPRQSSHSNKLSQNSSSKERISGSSTKSTEGRHAKTPCSKKEYSEQKWTCSGPDCQKKRGEDLEQTREDAPHQKLSADERRSKEQTCDKLVPEGRSRVEPEHSALASLTEKSVLQAMAQLQAQGAAGGTLSEGRNSAQLAARLTNTSAASSDLISMIQQVATQVITAVLDSRGASTTRASRRDPNRHRVKSVTKKAKSQSLGDPSTQQGTAKGTKGPSTQHGTAKGSKDPSTKQGTTKGTKGPSTKHGTTKSAKGLSTHKGSAKDTKGPRTQQGTAKNAKGLSPHKGSAKDTKGPRTQQGTAKGTKGPSPHKGSAKDTKGPRTQQGTAKGTKGPSPQQGTDKNTKGPSPHKGSAKDTKSPSTQQGTAKDTKGPSPQQGTVEGTKGPSSQQASADGTKGPSPQEGSADGIKGPSSQQGTDKDTKGPSPQQGTAKSTEAKRTSPESPCPKEDTSLCSQAKSKCVVSPSVQQGTAASDEEETMSVVDQWPEPVIAPSDKAADDRVLGLSPHQGTAVGSKSESQGVAASCGLKEGAAGSSETESLPVADPVPKQGTSASGETENKCPEVPSSQQDIGPNIKARQGDTEPVLVPGSVCPGSVCLPGEAAVSSQPVSKKAETSDVASPSPPPGTSGPCKAENEDAEQELVVSIPLSLVCLPGEAAVSSQPVSKKAETSDVASPSPQPGTPGPCKAENKDVELGAGSVPPCPGEAAVSSQPVTIKAETSDVASPSPQPGTSGPCKAENKDVEQELVAGGIPPCPGEAAVSSQPVTFKAETSDVAGPSPQPGTSGPCKAENKDVEQELVAGSIPPCPGEAAGSSQPVSIKAETSDVASPGPQPGTSGPCKAENKDVEQELVLGSVPPCPGEPAVSSQPVSIKVETSDVASPSPLLGTPGPCNAENEDVKQELALGSVPPCPGEAAVSSQPVSIKAETSDVASPGPQPGTPGPCKAENEDVKQELALGSVPPCPGEAAVSSQPVSIKAETSDVASPSPQPGTPGLCKAENEDVKQELALGSVPPCPGEAAGSSQPVSIKVETSDVDSPSPQPGTSEPCKAENKDAEQELLLGSVPPCPEEAAVSSQPVNIKAETSDVASPSPPPGTPGSCKAENEVVEQKLVAGSIPPCPGEAAVSSQPVSIKAETSDVASPSPPPGTSGPCKAENKDVEQELALENVPPCPGNPERASKRRVWICGQSVVVSAEKQASGTEAGSQLGLEEGVILEWHGQEGLTWTQLVPLLQSLAAQGQAPDVLVVHLGESDLEGHRGAPLASTIRKELELVKELFPQARILWSNLLLRRRGSGKAGSRTVNRARTVVNLEMGPFVATLGGAVIEHQAILHTDPDFYTDGDNLSGRGLDLFLEDVKNGILAHLQS